MAHSSDDSSAADTPPAINPHAVWGPARVLIWRQAVSRFQRTTLGSAWIVLSTTLWVGGFYVFGSAIFQRFDQDYLPYLAVGLCLWNFLSGVCVTAATSFTRHKAYIASFPFPLGLYPLVALGINVIVLAHMAVVFAPIVIVSDGFHGERWAVFALALGLYGALGWAAGVVLGAVGARFRDFGPLLQSVLRLGFILTPVFWSIDRLAPEHRWLVLWNPFYHLLDIGRAALLGAPASPLSWAVALSLTVLLIALALAMLPLVRTRIFHWV